MSPLSTNQKHRRDYVKPRVEHVRLIVEETLGTNCWQLNTSGEADGGCTETVPKCSTV